MIFGGDGMACIVGGESNRNTVINIGPFGVVMQGLDAAGGLIHKRDSLQEVLEIKGFVQGLAVFLPFGGFLNHGLGTINLTKYGLYLAISKLETMKSKITPIVFLGLFLTGVFWVIPSLSKAQGTENPSLPAVNGTDSSAKYFAITKDNGQEIIAKIIRQDAREMEVLTRDGRTIAIPQHVITQIKPVDERYFRAGKDYVDEDPYRTRYVITTNGLPIRKGQNYGQFTLLGPEAQFHLSDKVGVGVMTSWLGTPIVGTIKYSVSLSENVHFALGGLLGTGSWIDPDFGFALPFGAVTLGNGRYNINFSIGRGMIWNNDGVSAENLFSVGGMARITSKTSFVFDSFITEDLALLIPTLRIHRKSEGAFQFGFGQLVVEGESVPVPFFSRLWTL